MPNPTTGIGLQFWRDRRGSSEPEVKDFPAASGQTFYRGQPLAWDGNRITALPAASFTPGSNGAVVGVSNGNYTTTADLERVSVVLAEHALFAARFGSGFANADEAAAYNRIGDGYEFEANFADGNALGGSVATVSPSALNADTTWLILVDYSRRPNNDLLTGYAMGIFQWNPKAVTSDAAGTGSPVPVT